MNKETKMPEVACMSFSEHKKYIESADLAPSQKEIDSANSFLNQITSKQQVEEITIVESKHPITISFNGLVFGNAIDRNQWLVKLDSNSKGLIALDIQNKENLDKLIDKLLDHRNIINGRV